MFALNSMIEASGPHINVMRNCNIGDPEIHIFKLNLEFVAPELYIFRLNLEIWAVDFNDKLGIWDPSVIYFNA